MLLMSDLLISANVPDDVKAYALRITGPLVNLGIWHESIRAESGAYAMQRTNVLTHFTDLNRLLSESVIASGVADACLATFMNARHASSVQVPKSTLDRLGMLGIDEADVGARTLDIRDWHGFYPPGPTSYGPTFDAMMTDPIIQAGRDQVRGWMARIFQAIAEWLGQPGPPPHEDMTIGELIERGLIDPTSELNVSIGLMPSRPNRPEAGPPGPSSASDSGTAEVRRR